MFITKTVLSLCGSSFRSYTFEVHVGTRVINCQNVSEDAIILHLWRDKLAIKQSFTLLIILKRNGFCGCLPFTVIRERTGDACR